MKKPVGIRREDKNEWERRTPLTPDDVRYLREKHAISFVVQPSPIRVFPDKEYREAGAEINEDLSDCPLVMGVKEMPASFFQKGKSYCFFSHTIKGQRYNMPMLARLKELGCNLLDYEKIEDEKGRRLVFFGRYAGLAGMLDGLWMLGRRLEADGYPTALTKLKRAKDYSSLKEAKDLVAEAGRAFAHDGLPGEIKPLVVAFAGYGHVSQGAQEILAEIPHRQVEPPDLQVMYDSYDGGSPSIWKVVFREEHLVEPVTEGKPFILQEYYDHPERYRGIFPKSLPCLTMIVNSIFWTPACPKLMTKDDARRLYESEKPKLKAIADITCDPGGSIECTTHCTDIGNPIFVYDAMKDKPIEAATGNGPSVLAVDNLPAELPRESSTYFSRTLRDIIPGLVDCVSSETFNDANLPDPLKRALILNGGRFTKPFSYMEQYLTR